MRKFHFLHSEVERREWQNPEAILAEVGLKPGMTFVDIGCGNGFFALPAARIVGPSGKVYALDADHGFITELRVRAAKEKLRNIIGQVGRGEEAMLCRQCGDIVFFGNVLHDFDDPAKVLRNARESVKPDGKLADVDWDVKPSPSGPPQSIRFSRAKAQELIATAGFKFETARDAGPYHYIVIAVPV
jgi:ubiquinone/menaquinone biosynthesis C-methylase UbiE